MASPALKLATVETKPRPRPIKIKASAQKKAYARYHVLVSRDRAGVLSPAQVLELEQLKRKFDEWDAPATAAMNRHFAKKLANAERAIAEIKARIESRIREFADASGSQAAKAADPR